MFKKFQGKGKNKTITVNHQSSATSTCLFRFFYLLSSSDCLRGIWGTWQYGAGPEFFVRPIVNSGNSSTSSKKVETCRTQPTPAHFKHVANPLLPLELVVFTVPLPEQEVHLASQMWIGVRQTLLNASQVSSFCERVFPWAGKSVVFENRDWDNLFRLHAQTSWVD